MAGAPLNEREAIRAELRGPFAVRFSTKIRTIEQVFSARLLASALPGRHAGRVDTTIALRTGGTIIVPCCGCVELSSRCLFLPC